MSQLIVIKCTSADQIYFVEVDTSAHGLTVVSPNGMAVHAGLTRLVPGSSLYEASLGLRYAKDEHDALNVLRALGYPQKLVYELFRVEPIGKKLVLDVMPASIPAADSAKVKKVA